MFRHRSFNTHCRYSQCACVDPDQWTFRFLVPNETNQVVQAPLCERSSQCYRNALRNLSDSPEIWYAACSACTVDCNSTDYVPRISSLEALLDWDKNQLKRQVESFDVPLPINWSETWETHLTKNYIAVEVRAEKSSADQYKEQASMTGTDVLSNVGGQSGLWIGISFLTLMEFVEMLYRLIRYQYQKLWRRFPRPQINT